MSSEDSTVGKRGEDVLSLVYRQTNVSEMEQSFRARFLYGWRSRKEADRHEADWRRKLLLLKLLSHIHSAHGKHFFFFARKIRECPTNTCVCLKVELQALALRTGRIYIQELPTLLRREVEIFLDFEGIPDQKFHYLIGLLINERGNRSYSPTN